MWYRSVLLVALILCSHNLSAQIDFEDDWNAMFNRVRSSGMVSNACLWEYGLTDTSLLNYKGLNGDDTVSFANWSALYDCWGNSVMDSLLIPKEKKEILNWYNQYFKKGIVPVSAIMVHGSKFKSTAIENGDLYFDTVQSQFLYKSSIGIVEDANVFISAPFVQNFYDKSAKFIFSDSFFFSNTGLSVTEIHFKINDLPFAKAELNQITNIELKPGSNTLTLQWLFSNGLFFRSKVSISLLETHSSFGNDQLMPPLIGDEFRNIYTEPFRKTETEEPLGAYIEVLPGIENGLKHTCIKKPIIFVEGIDFGYEDHPTGCYGGKCGNVGLRDLMRGSIFNPYETKLKHAFEDWEPIKKAPKLIAELQSAGYDLIYLDFHNGADYIENNAMLLVELIKRVNFIKCSSEEIVVIGASMGGLVSRFALSYMEKKGIPHCVRTFLSFDSPQNGANISLGLQHCLKYYRKKLPGIKDKFDRKLDRAAARQMLVQNSLSENGFKEHGDRIDLVSKLEGLGSFPSHCRKIALVNGSITGQNQGFDPGDVLLKMNPYLGKFNFDMLEISCTVWATYALIDGKNLVLSALYPFSKKALVEVKDGIYCFDNMPGSLRFDLEDSRAIYGVFNVINKRDGICFIPTHSALALKYEGYLDDINATIPMNAPNHEKYAFDAYFGEAFSQEHMMITDNNIDWILNQLEMNKNELLTVLDRRYNFGRFERNVISTVEVGSGGELCVNCEGRSGFGNGDFDTEIPNNSQFHLFTSECGNIITISNGGRLQIGSDESHIGYLHVRSGSVLELLPGSELVVNQMSELFIEEGAEIIIHPDAKIVLDGVNALLKIDGLLRLKDNAVFSIENRKSEVKGCVHFRSIRGGYGNAKVVVEGSNVSFDLKGSGMNYQILQIEGILNIGVEFPLKSFSALNSKFAYGSNSLLRINGEVFIEKINFYLLPWATKRNPSALDLGKFNRCRILQSNFQDFNFAIITSSDFDEASLEIENCEFKYCNNAVFMHAATVKFNHCRFVGMFETAILYSGDLKELNLKTCSFISNKLAISLLNSNISTTYVFASDLTFTSNLIAIQCEFVELSLSCSRFLSNLTSIKAKNASLNLSKLHLTKSNSNASFGGENTFYHVEGVALDLNNCFLYIEKGANNFIHQGNAVNADLIIGQLTFSLATHDSNKPYNLRGDGNYWYPTPYLGL
ncbi:MAG: hypothetical protein IT245_08705, partial [Bacteroidia bacterium]|nr:hypothetical protein [Bacteroidia bacterium]